VSASVIALLVVVALVIGGTAVLLYRQRSRRSGSHRP
jgi:hypothetical protein